MTDTADPPHLSFVTRLWFAYACFFRVLFDAAFAARAFAARALPSPAPARAPSVPPPAPPPPPTGDPALQLLSLFQREGRLIDFLEQDIATFKDAEIGAAARVVHEGCRKALRTHATLEPVRAEEEGTKVEVAEGYKPAEVKLSGNVQGAAPYSGVLRHRGWRAKDLRLPTPVKGYDAHVLAPAEVEL